jgi:hypothetical protein
MTQIDRRAVLDAARRRSAALVNKDVDVLSALLHPEFLYVNASGTVLSREEYLDSYVRPPDVRWASQTIDQPRVVSDGSVAVLTCLVHDVASFFGQDLDQTFRTTSTWLKSGRDWQCLAGHTSSLG